MVIKVPSGSRKGYWRITSVKDTVAYGIAVDLASVHGTKLAKGNAPVERLQNDGMLILTKKPTTSGGSR
jgi:hypothetical protein